MCKRVFLGLLVVVFLFPSIVLAGRARHVHLEKEYQAVWCVEHKGIQEVRLPDRARVDCVTETHAVEAEFAYKWAESIGQSLYYASQTQKRAGILLIIERTKDQAFVDRLESTIKLMNLPIDVWKVDSSVFSKQ